MEVVGEIAIRTGLEGGGVEGCGTEICPKLACSSGACGTLIGPADTTFIIGGTTFVNNLSARVP
jgi:hypothetical protein